MLHMLVLICLMCLASGIYTYIMQLNEGQHAHILSLPSQYTIVSGTSYGFLITGYCYFIKLRYKEVR